MKDNILTIYLISEDYSDWGGTSQKCADQQKSKTFCIDSNCITKEFLLKCIQEAGKELNDQYLLPEKTEDLSFS